MNNSNKKGSTKKKQVKVLTTLDANGQPQSEALKKLAEGKRFFKAGMTNQQEKKKGAQQKNSLDEAFFAFSAACNADSSLAQAFNGRGKCYMQFKDFKRALYDFSAAIKAESKGKDKITPSNSDLAEFYMNAGQCNQLLGQYEEALAHYDIALKKNDSDGAIYFNRGQTNASLQRFEDAIKDLKKAIEITNTSEIKKVYNIRYNLGITLRRVGRLDESIEELKKAVEVQQDKPPAWNNLGLSQFENEEWDEALQSYTKAIVKETQHVTTNNASKENLSFYHNNRGLAYYHLNDKENAEKDYNEAIKYNETNAENYFNRGNVYLNQGRYPEAHNDFDRAIELEQTNAKLYHAKGLAYQSAAEDISMNNGDIKEEDDLVQHAIAYFGQALEFCDTFISSMFHQGLMFRRTLDFHQALRQFTKVKEQLPNDKTVYIQRGLVYQDMGNHQFAIEDFQKAIELDPKYYLAHFHLGVSKLKSKKVRDAIEDFKRSNELDFDTKNPGVFDGLGCCYHALQKYDDAISYFNEAIDKTQGENVEFLKNRAQCYYDLRHYPDAIADLEMALNLKEDDPQVLYKLGLTFFAYQRYKKCIKTLKLALKNKPFLTYEPDVFYHIGLAYCRVQKFEKSIYPYSRCIERIPSDIRYVHERAKAYQMINYHDKAVTDFDIVIKKNPKNAHAHFRRAFSLKALKRYAEAADDFEKAKILDPMNPKMVVNYKKLKGITCIVLCEPGEEKIFQ